MVVFCTEFSDVMIQNEAVSALVVIPLKPMPETFHFS